MLESERTTKLFQAQKFGSFAGDDDDDEIDEESLLETPLDKLEPYGIFKHVFLSAYYNLVPGTS